MDTQKQSAIDRLKQATNVLVTVNSNPSVDQLAACIGLTVMLNSLGKHGTAVFSGAVPSTIGFLQPEKTLEKNTDSLRDFIISLDKSKADKLRYKVEDTVVKIFITPYRTSISDKDLEFSQGDFNVDVVVALGVHDQKELDQAITSHGRILHDATIISINTQPGNNIGTINWQDPQASSLSEMVASMADSFDKKVLDNQVATALLTGIVAETERFSNDKTSPNTMKVSAQLMGAGANQQLVAEKLEEPQALPPSDDRVHDNGVQPPEEPPKSGDGTLQIEHMGNGPANPVSSNQNDDPKSGDSDNQPVPSQPAPGDDDVLGKLLKSREESQIHVDENGQMSKLGDNRKVLQGPGPSDAQSVLPSMQETELPSGVPGATQGYAYDPTAPAGPPPDAAQAENDAPLSQSPGPQQDAQLLQHDNQSDQPSSDDQTDAPADDGQSLEIPDTPPPPVPQPPMPANDGGNLPDVPSATQIPDFNLPPPGGDNNLSQPSPPPVPVPPAQTPAPEPPKPDLPHDNETLTELEKDLNSPHASKADTAKAEAEVQSAEENGPPPVPEPIAALNAAPMGASLHDDSKADEPKDESTNEATTPAAGKLAEPLASSDPKDDTSKDMPLKDTLKPPESSSIPPTSSPGGPTPPPPVPPPMMPIPPTNG